MNLHEIYEMLMRRGMPKHRDLVWTAFAEPCVACALNGDVAILTTNTAHDLIAMHALRWAGTLGLGLDEVDICETAGSGNAYWTLERILAATEHLEPKGDDDAKHP